MRTLAVVNAVALSSHAHRPLRAGRSALELALEAAAALPAVERVLLYVGEDALAAAAARKVGVEAVGGDAWDPASLLRRLDADAEGFDHLIYLFGDCPFIDTALAAGMFDNHREYFADYTFADGYPQGIAVEILKRGVLPALAKLAADLSGPLTRETIFEVVRKDINAFDLETKLSPEDLRSLRLCLAADSRRNFLLLERLERQGVRSAAEVAKVVTGSPALLRTLPAYVTVQIVEGCPQLCSYCPYPSTLLRSRGVTAPGKAAEMAPERFGALLDEVERFCGDAVVSVSLWGEPALHGEIAALLVDAASRPALTVHVETSGVGWRREDLEAVRARAARPPAWIVSLDAWAPEVYTRLRGAGHSEAVETAELLRSLFPDRVWLQAVRMAETEEDTERFYREWKEQKASTIIQKYDSFAGLLPDRALTDLSPLRRPPCWHLKRDLPVLLDGSVPACREALRGEMPLGNVFTDGIEAVWSRGEALHLEHAAGRYPELCRSCDEYYTYNA